MSAISLTNGLSTGPIVIVAIIIVIVGFVGSKINEIIVLQLDRQDCIHRFYFRRFPPEISKELLPNIYSERQGSEQENEQESSERAICERGAKIRYVESWKRIFKYMTTLFSVLLYGGFVFFIGSLLHMIISVLN